MAKTKEGRRRMSRLDFSTEGGRALFWALSNPSASGFSPFLESDHQSKRFWESNKLFQQVSFPAFRGHAAQLADIAIAQMTEETKNAEMARIAKLTQATRVTTPKKKSTKSTEANHENCQQSATKLPQCSKFQQANNIKVQSLRDTIVAAHPNGEMAIIIFELDGDTDEKACQLQFAKEGRKIKVYSRIPSELTNAVSLLGNKENRSSIQDADCMLLDISIKKRLEGSTKDDNGDYWEVREVIDLPFQCKNSIFNKHRKEISTYLLRKNDQGYAWGYFWVVGSHVGQKDIGPTKIRCQASSDCESDEVDENQSHLFSSDEEQENDVVEMEVEFESSAVYHKNQTTQKYSRSRDDQEADIRKLKKNLELRPNEALRFKSATDTFSNITVPELEKQLRSKDEELVQTNEEMAKLRRLVDQSDELVRKLNSENKHLNQEVTKLRGLVDQNDGLLRKLKSENERLVVNNSEKDKWNDGYRIEIANLKHILENERAESLRRLSFLEKECQTQERGQETYRENIRQLETEVKRLNVDNQLKQELLKELDLSCEKKEKQHNQSQQVLKESHNQMAVLLQEAKQNIDDSEKKLKASFGKVQEVEKVLQEKEQQCVYQMDQIERLHCQVHEREQSVLLKDSLIKTHLDEIHGLKRHILFQGNLINDLEREVGRLKNLKNSVRLTPGKYSKEEQKIEFDELNRWDSEKSLKTVSPTYAQMDQQELNYQSVRSSQPNSSKENMETHNTDSTSFKDSSSKSSVTAQTDQHQEINETDNANQLDFTANIPVDQQETSDNDESDTLVSNIAGDNEVCAHIFERQETNEESGEEGRISADAKDNHDNASDNLSKISDKEDISQPMQGEGSTTNNGDMTNKDDHDDSNELTSIAGEDEDSIEEFAGKIQKEATCKEGREEFEGKIQKEATCKEGSEVTFFQDFKVACAKNKTKKRKSTSDLPEAPEMKKLRKSQRLENKRLAKKLKQKSE